MPDAGSEVPLSVAHGFESEVERSARIEQLRQREVTQLDVILLQPAIGEVERDVREVCEGRADVVGRVLGASLQRRAIEGGEPWCMGGGGGSCVLLLLDLATQQLTLISHAVERVNQGLMARGQA